MRTNLLGQLGTGAAQNQTGFLPAIVTVPGPFKSLSTGGNHTCTVLDNGSAMCWGSNFYGQLGNSQSGGSENNYDSTIDSNIPNPVSFNQPVKAISVGNTHSCVVLDNHSAMCWGDNTYGQLGNGNSGSGQLSNVPVAVSALGPIKSISLGYQHTCAVLSDESLKCWGSIEDGQLGNGVTSGLNAVNPVSVSGLGAVRSISLGYSHSCALLSNQRAKCWGSNNDGQLGNGSSGTDNATPGTVINLTNIQLP